MPDNMTTVIQLSELGFCCSQILLTMGLKEQAKENPDLIRAMGGLCGGVGNSGKNCGAFTGGACLLSLYVGRGKVDEEMESFGPYMMAQYVRWFEEEHPEGVDCMSIINNDSNNIPLTCPNLICSVYEKVEQILKNYDISLERRR